MNENHGRRLYLYVCAGIAAIEMAHFGIRIFLRGEMQQAASSLLSFAFIGFSVIFGAWRLSRRHPVLMKDYRDWLMGTPYHPGRGLPMGSPLPQLADLALLILAGLAFSYHASYIRENFGDTASPPLSPATFALFSIAGMIIAYGIGYTAVSIYAHYRAGSYRTLALLFAAGLGWIHEALSPAPALLPEFYRGRAGRSVLLVFGLFAIFAINAKGIASGMRRYPWREYFEPTLPLPPVRQWLKQFAAALVSNRSTARAKGAELGYPLTFMKARDGEQDFSFEWRWIAVLSISWAFLTIGDVASQSTDPSPTSGLIPNAGFIMFCLFFTLCVAGGRLVVYTSFCSSPISLWGRIGTGRLIIPGFDRILVVPLIIAVVGIIAPIALLFLPFYFPLMLSVYIGGMLAIAFFAPPTLRNWQMTGDYRMAIPASEKRLKSQYAKTNA